MTVEEQLLDKVAVKFDRFGPFMKNKMGFQAVLMDASLSERTGTGKDREMERSSSK